MRKISAVAATVMGSLACVSCGGGGGGSNGGGGTVQNVAVSVSALSPTVAVGAHNQFTATVTGTTNTAVTWAVMGGAGNGTISATGVYTAPASVPNPATITVTATSMAKSTSVGTRAVVITLVPPGETLQASPVVLGTSGSNINDQVQNVNSITCCGGTLGSLVARGGAQFILSNNHVLARSDAGTKTSGGTPGDAITQPGLVDSRCGLNNPPTVANLTDFFNLETGSQATNIDAAIAKVVNGAVDPNGKILELGNTATNGIPDPGAPSSTTASATTGTAVAKSGRTTGLTCSTVTGINVTVLNVTYQKTCGGATSFSASYSGQVMVGGGSFSAEGDSGSLIVEQSNARPVALLYAGSDTDTVGNPIAAVLSFFSTGGNAMTIVGGGDHAVIGCMGPFPLAVTGVVPNSLVGQAGTTNSDAMQRALAIRDAHKSELMAHPEAQAIGVGASYDNAEEPAILFFVTRGAARTGIPAEVDGVRTRIIEGDLFAARGVLTQAQSAQLEQSAGAPPMAYSLPDTEVKRALTVQAAHQDEWLGQAGVQAVGVTSSVDSPGESALLIYLVRGEAHPAIPAVIDGLRTRVREGSRFKAGVGGKEEQPQTCKVPMLAPAKKEAPAAKPPRTGK